MNSNIIAFTIDENYIEPFIVAIQSFLEFHDNNKYIIILIQSNIKDNSLDKIVTYFKSINLRLIVKEIDDTFQDIQVGYHFNSVIFYRLLLPELFPNYKTILYLDSDILFNDNIDDLFNTNLNGKILAAIPKHNFFEIPEYLRNETKNYFASGLLLINTKEFITSKTYEKCLDFLKNEKYEMPDQDALNFSVGRWIELDMNYSVETAFLASDNSELKANLKKPKIIQFSGSSKPWHFMNSHPYKKLYWTYLKMTPFKRYVPEDLTVVNVVKWMIPKGVKEFIKGKLK